MTAEVGVRLIVKATQHPSKLNSIRPITLSKLDRKGWKKRKKKLFSLIYEGDRQWSNRSE